MKPLLLTLLLCPLPLLADFSGKCVSVSDGDTITVLTAENTQIKVRLYGIDCPEKKQDFGQKAKEFTSSLVFGKQVDVKEREKDRYGRTIGKIYQDGKYINLEIVKAGFAWHYKQYSKDTDLAEAEGRARESKTGLWSGKPIPPWEFRRKPLP